jgi:hypothetical protein
MSCEHEKSTQRNRWGRCVLCLREAQARYRLTEKGRACRNRKSRKAAGMIDPSPERRVGHCEACGHIADPLCLDHDHTTGAVRGWLCGPCNRALGFLQDSAERCALLANYRNRF